MTDHVLKVKQQKQKVNPKQKTKLLKIELQNLKINQTKQKKLLKYN